MIESNSVEVGTGDLPRVFLPSRSIPATLEATRSLLLALLLCAAAAVRLAGLGASGFSEDEINKLRAVEAYGVGDFSANAEHPMLMKLADWASLSAAGWWNGHAGSSAFGTISAEAALRAPNALAGAATTVVVFLLTEALFDTPIAAWAACFWALDVNAAAINRIGKEDTFLVFFLLLAAWFYERAKAAPPAEAGAWYLRSGSAFGLMLASKYMPHYFGLHALFNIAADRHPADDRPDKRPAFYAVMAATFLVVNFAVLLPSTWRYVLGYVHGETLRHTGYTFAHRLYVNGTEATPWGLPPWFYVTFLVTKMPLLVLAAAALGIVWVVRHADHRGATFVRVFVVFTLLPYSLVASKFLRYMLPLLVVLDIAAAVGVVWLLRRMAAARIAVVRDFAPAALTLVMLLGVGASVTAAQPFYGLAQNVLGACLGAPGSLFPDDEFYDAGVREAVEAIAPVAAPGALLCSDATAVVAEYLRRSGRTDMTACSIAHDGLPMRRVDTWVIAQDGHLYFENAQVIETVRRRNAPWRVVRVAGVTAATVYHLP